jgi:hypothetical protein
VSYRAAQRAGQAFDPRNIDFSKFKDGKLSVYCIKKYTNFNILGFNLTDYDPSVKSKRISFGQNQKVERYI